MAYKQPECIRVPTMTIEKPSLVIIPATATVCAGSLTSISLAALILPASGDSATGVLVGFADGSFDADGDIFAGTGLP